MLCGATSTHPEQQIYLTMQSACFLLGQAWPGPEAHTLEESSNNLAWYPSRRLAGRVPISFLPRFPAPLLCSGTLVP